MNRIIANAAAVSLACATAGTLALGFGRPHVVPVMGRPLEAVIPMRLDEGDELAGRCVSAEVFYGETRQAPERVSTEVEPGVPARVRVRSLVPVDEPVVSVYVTVGCTSRMTRKWVAFADPPGDLLPAGPGGAADPAVALTAPVDAPAAEGPAPIGQAAAGQPGEAGAAGIGSTVAPEQAQALGAAPRPSPAAARHQKTRVASVSAAAPRRGTAARAHSPRRLAAQRAPEVPLQRSRLQLDLLETRPLDEPTLRLSTEFAAGPAQQSSEARAAAAALWRAMNASPEELLRDRQRLAELEAGFERLRGEIAQSQQSMTRLEARVRQAPARNDAQAWAVALGTLAAGLTVALAWLVLQRRRAPVPGPGDWDAQVHEEIQSTLSPPVAAVVTPDLPVPAGAPVPPAVAAADPPAMDPLAGRPATDAARGEPASPVQDLPFIIQAPERARSAAAASSQPATIAAVRASVPRRGTAPLPRPMSVDELIDLEQQAEFFAVLGQDEAAIDLLLAHIRSPVATSPLPYLKLLDLYQRRGDPVEYERVRRQFSAQFKTQAPAWEDDLGLGPALDGYPSVMGRLQRRWASAVQALELLQAMLLGLEESARPLSLPAYRELLMLYAVARDLAAHDEGGVDVLLPLDDPVDASRPARLAAAPTAVAPPAIAPDAARAAAPVPLLQPARSPAAVEAAVAEPTLEDMLSLEAMNLFINAGPDRRR